MTQSSDWLLVYEGFDPEEEGRREALCVLGNGVFVTRGAARGVAGRRRPLPRHVRRGGLRPPGHARSAAARSSTRTWSTSPTGCRSPSGPRAGPGSPRARELLDVSTGARHARGRAHPGAPSYATTPGARPASGAAASCTWSSRTSRRSSTRSRPRTGPAASRCARCSTDRWSTPASPATGTSRRSTSRSWTRAREGTRRLAPRAQPCSRASRSACRRARGPGAATRRSHVERRLVEEPERIGTELSFDVGRGETVAVEKMVALYTSRDPGISEAGLEAREALARAGRFEELLRSHALAWRALWRRCDIRLEPVADEQRILRLHIFHLLQTASLTLDRPRRRRPGPGLARGGLPRAHLLGRAVRLPVPQPALPDDHPRAAPLPLPPPEPRPAAAARAERVSGRDVPVAERQRRPGGDAGAAPQPHVRHAGCPTTRRLQRHVNAAIAYNIWQYYAGHRRPRLPRALRRRDAARDRPLLGLAWRRMNDGLGRYEIHGVMGPDEYHDGYPDYAGARPATTTPTRT